MKKVIFLVLIVACVQGYFYLQPRMFRYVLKNPEAQITLYGNEGCSVCEYLKSGMNANKITYTYKDVVKYKEVNKELWIRIHTKYEESPSFRLPVVIIDDEILFHYDFPRLMAEYATKKFVLFD